MDQRIIYNDMPAEDIIKIVGKLNDEIYEKTESNNHGMIYGNLVSANFVGLDIAIVEFADTQIWNSDEDEREFLDDHNTWADFEEFLRKEINKMTEIISMIKL